MKLDKDTKVFISGCGGMLGEAVYREFSGHCNVLATDIDQNEDWLTYADVRDYHKMMALVKSYEPDLIINLAALTDLEICEQDPENAWNTNALGAENMALIAQKLDVVHIYISTAGIFDGEQEFFNDFATPNPMSIYGKAKYYGELSVQHMLKKYFVFRAGWMMGGGVKKDKKFINKIFKQIEGGSKKLYVVDDKLGTPTYTVNFAKSMFKVATSDLYGLYNMVCSGSCSRYDVAIEFVKYLGLKDEIDVEIVDSDFFKKEYFAPRPFSEKLINFKLERRGLNYMEDWKVCLKKYAEEFKSHLRTVNEN